MISRTSADRPSAPLRKSTGRVASITRTAPDGPITRRPSAPAVPSRVSRYPRRDRSGSSRRRSQPRSFRQLSAPSIGMRPQADPPQQPRVRTRAHPIPQKQLPHLAIGAASRTIAAATNHGGERSHTELPLDANSATIRTFSSWSQVRRRPVPVNTSTRCAGLLLASLAVIILNLAAQTSPQALRSPPHSEGDACTSLTLNRG
jgi:hypothetical protein